MSWKRIGEEFLYFCAAVVFIIMAVVLTFVLLTSCGYAAEPPQAPSLREWQAPPVQSSPSPAYRWSREHAGQLSLWDGQRFAGAYREVDGQYLAWPGWTPAALPVALPEGGQQRPFALDTTPGTDARSVEPTTPKSPSSTTTAGTRRTGTSVRSVAPVGGITMGLIPTFGARLCVGRT